MELQQTSKRAGGDVGVVRVGVGQCWGRVAVEQGVADGRGAPLSPGCKRGKEDCTAPGLRRWWPSLPTTAGSVGCIV